MDKILLCRIMDRDDRDTAEACINKELSSGEWEVKQIHHLAADDKSSNGNAAATLVVVLHKVQSGCGLCSDSD